MSLAALFNKAAPVSTSEDRFVVLQSTGLLEPGQVVSMTDIWPPVETVDGIKHRVPEGGVERLLGLGAIRRAKDHERDLQKVELPQSKVTAALQEHEIERLGDQVRHLEIELAKSRAECDRLRVIVSGGALAVPTLPAITPQVAELERRLQALEAKQQPQPEPATTAGKKK